MVPFGQGVARLRRLVPQRADSPYPDRVGVGDPPYAVPHATGEGAVRIDRDGPQA